MQCSSASPAGCCVAVAAMLAGIGALRHANIERASSFLEAKEHGQRCSSSEWLSFTKMFHMTCDTGGVCTSGEYGSKAATGNVVYMFPADDHNGAFRIDAHLCHRIMMWIGVEGVNSVTVARVASTDGAHRMLSAFQDKSIQHLVLGGHGHGDYLVWGDLEHGHLEVGTKHSEAFLAFAGTKLNFGSSVFLDSCLGATEHEPENLAAFISRILGRTAPAGINVFAPVHSFGSPSLDVSVQNGEYRASVIHGSKMYRVAPDVSTGVSVGDWVKSHFYVNRNMKESRRSRAGIVTEIQSTSGGYLLDIIFAVGGLARNLPLSLVSQVIKPGQVVHLHLPEANGRPPLKLDGVFMGPQAVSTIEDGANKMIHKALVQAKDGRYLVARPDMLVAGSANAEIEGDNFPEINDLLLAPYNAAGAIGLGAVVGKTMEGASVYFYGLETINVNAGRIVSLIKAGARIRAFHGQSNALRLGYFKGADGSGVSIQFDGLGSTELVQTTHLTDVSDGKRALLRSTMDGCMCKKTWQVQGFQNACTNFCCNPFDKPDGDWCFKVDPTCGNGHGYGVCRADPTLVTSVVKRAIATPNDRS